MSSSTKETIGIIGGTGFVGRSLVSALKEKNQRQEIRILSRNPPAEVRPGVSWQKVDVKVPETLEEGLEGCSTIYYLPGILTESRDQKYEEVHVGGIAATLRILIGRPLGRLVHVSAIGVSNNAPSAYLRTKKKAENAIVESGIPFTIVRPSLIFGEGDKAIGQFLDLGRLFHLLPMIGPGTARVQPVFAGDLARFLALVTDLPETEGKVFEVGGPRIYTYREMMESLRRSAHLKAAILPVPVGVMMAIGVLQAALFSKPLLTPDVVRMALADNITPQNAPVVEFGMSLVSLESWIESRSY